MNKKKFLILSAIGVIIIFSLVFTIKKILLKHKEITRAKVAIIIDDWGYNLRYINLLTQIGAPVTVSILPNLRYSTKIAQSAKELGQEVILHLPLEPELEERKDIRLEQNTITTGMTKGQIVENFNLAFNSVPFASGVSNHMGSLATKNSRVMSTIFSELKKRKLFFLDNLVIDDSVCQSLAKQMRVKFISRDVFLDNLSDQQYIRGQVEKLAEAALINGQAVGIAHARIKSLQVLKEQIPLLQKKGIKFVFVSELTK